MINLPTKIWGLNSVIFSLTKGLKNWKMGQKSAIFHVYFKQPDISCPMCETVST